MKICILSTTFPRWKDDNVPLFIHDLSISLAEHAEIIVIAPHYDGAMETESIDGIRVRRFRYAPASKEILAYNGGLLAGIRNGKNRIPLISLFMISFLLTTLIECLRNRPDIIHSHWVIPSGLIGLLVGKTLRIPCVVSAHGSDVFEERDNTILNFIRKLVLKKCSAVTGNSLGVLKALKEYGSVPERTHLIPMGIDISIFKPDVRLIGERLIQPSLVFVGRLIEVKGVDLLIDAFEVAKREFIDLRLLIVGDGPQKSELMRKCKLLNLNDSVEFLGWINHKELPGLIKKATILVAPSRTTETGGREGFGLAILEAMASGVPIIASNSAGIADLIDNGETGLLVDPENICEFSEALAKLLRNDDLRHHIAKKAIIKSREYSWEKIGASFIELFTTIKNRE